MHMIRHSAYPIGFAIALAHRSGEEGMDFLTNAGFKPRVAVLRAPDQVDEDVGEIVAWLVLQ